MRAASALLEKVLEGWGCRDERSARRGIGRSATWHDCCLATAVAARVAKRKASIAPRLRACVREEDEVAVV